MIMDGLCRGIYSSSLILGRPKDLLHAIHITSILHLVTAGGPRAGVDREPVVHAICERNNFVVTLICL
jgi:hypothetical protein